MGGVETVGRGSLHLAEVDGRLSPGYLTAWPEQSGGWLGIFIRGDPAGGVATWLTSHNRARHGPPILLGETCRPG